MLVVTWLLTITYYALAAIAYSRNTSRETQPTAPTPRAVAHAETTGFCPACLRPVSVSGFVKVVGCSYACTVFAGHDITTHERYGAEHRVLPALVRRVQTGPLVVDGELRQAFLGPYELGLTQREYQLLAVLAGSLGRTCRIQEIAREMFSSLVRGGEAEAHTLRVLKARLIQRLEGAGELIETIAHQGYRLVAAPPSEYQGPPPQPRMVPHGSPRLETWSRRYAACRACGSVIRPHRGHGLCSRCWPRWYRGALVIPERNDDDAR
jgi:DNA-binding winged helix-turn-helix (wHTH) protein